MLEEIESFSDDSKPIKYFKSNIQSVDKELAISVNDLSVKWDPVCIRYFIFSFIDLHLYFRLTLNQHWRELK